MTDLARPLVSAFNTANFTFSLQLSDLKNDDAIRRARGDSGASISWIAGHLLSFRYSGLIACGREQSNPWEAKFSFEAPATSGEEYPQIAELRQAWDTTHARLLDTLAGLTSEQLLAPTELPSPDGQATLLDGLSFIAWHEAYHVGVVGLLRAQWGHRRTHELAMESMGMEAGS